MNNQDTWVRLPRIAEVRPAITLTPIEGFKDGDLVAEQAYQVHEGEPHVVNQIYAEFVAKFGDRWYFVCDGAGLPSDNDGGGQDYHTTAEAAINQQYEIAGWSDGEQ